MCFRLIAMTIVLAVVPLFIMRGMLLLNIQDKLWNERVDNIERHSSYLASQIVKLNYFNDENVNIINNLISQLDSIYNGRVIVVDENFSVRKDSYSRINDKKVITPEVIACMSKMGSEPTYNKVYDMIETIVPVTDGGGVIRGAIIIDASTLDLTATYHSLKRMSTFVAIGFSMILIVLASLIGKAFTKPFKNVARSINRISEGYFDEEVHLKGYAEIETISEAFNVMLKRLKDLEDSRQEFVSNVSHELKTPLTSISGFAEIIKNGIVKEEDIPRFAGRIYDEAQRLITLVEDIIKLSQLDEKQIASRKEKLDLYLVCQDVLYTLETAAGEKHLSVELSGKHIYVEAVQQILGEIIYNLCDNAIKYNKDYGAVKVFVSEEDGRPAVSVSDTGIGIPEEDLSRVFERFFRVNKSHSKEIGGTGLGLSIVKHGAAYHDADIRMKSKLGEGTEITIIF